MENGWFWKIQFFFSQPSSDHFPILFQELGKALQNHYPHPSPTPQLLKLCTNPWWSKPVAAGFPWKHWPECPSWTHGTGWRVSKITQNTRHRNLPLRQVFDESLWQETLLMTKVDENLQQLISIGHIQTDVRHIVIHSCETLKQPTTWQCHITAQTSGVSFFWGGGATFCRYKWENV